jgi:predicted heme/steroid binding protein
MLLWEDGMHYAGYCAAQHSSSAFLGDRPSAS